MPDPALTAIRLLDAVALVSVLGLLVVAWLRRGDTDAQLLFGLLVGVAVWIAGDLWVKLGVAPEWHSLLVDLQLTASALTVAFLFLFVAAYTGRATFRSNRWMAALSVEPVVVTALIWTNGAHGLVYPPSVEGSRVVPNMGPGLLVHALYSYFLVLLSVAILVEFLARTNYRYRRQVYAIGIGAVVPLLGNALYLFGVSPYDLTPVSYAVTGLLLTGAVVRADLLRVTPIARNVVLDTAPVSVVVLDRDGVVVDANPVARSLFDAGDDRLVGTAGDELFGTYPALSDRLDDALPADRTGEFTVEGEEYAFEVRTAPLSEARGKTLGSLVLVDEITERREYRRRLEERTDRLELLNRVVRHDIRNDMQLTLGYLDALEGHVDEEGEEYLRTLEETSEHVVDLTTSVRELMETMLEERDLEPVDLASVLRDEVEDLQSSNDAAVVAVDGDLPPVRVSADDMLGSVFRNLLKNAVQHNDQAVPEVRVSVADRDDDVVVSVADNGPGIPDERKDEVFGRGEMGLESEGTGVGLYLVSTLVGEYGGEVWIEDGERRSLRADGAGDHATVGAVFRVRLPKADA